jgi:hypothetical protein
MLFASRRVTTHADRNSTPDVVTTNLQTQCSKFKSLQKKKCSIRLRSQPTTRISSITSAAFLLIIQRPEDDRLIWSKHVADHS